MIDHPKTGPPRHRWRGLTNLGAHALFENVPRQRVILRYLFIAFKPHDVKSEFLLVVDQTITSDDRTVFYLGRWWRRRRDKGRHWSPRKRSAWISWRWEVLPGWPVPPINELVWARTKL